MKIQKIKLEDEIQRICEHNDYCFIRKQYQIDNCERLNCKQIIKFYDRYGDLDKYESEFFGRRE